MFSSKEEFAKAMIDGRVFQYDGTKFYARWETTKTNFPRELRFCGSNSNKIENELHDFWKYYSHVSEVLPWYERIPKQGVLCWAWDDQIPDARVALIRSYEPRMLYPYNGMWGNAKPLTLDEAKQMVVEE